MTNCPICNRETEEFDLDEDWDWCTDCFEDWQDSSKLIAELAANRAREFEKEKTKILVEALEVIVCLDHDEYNCKGNTYCHVEAAQEALEEYKGKK